MPPPTALAKDLQRIMVRRVVGHAFEPDHDVRLFEAPLQPVFATDVGGLQGDWTGLRHGGSRKMLFRVVDHLLMVDGARGAHHHRAALIVARQIGADPIAVEGRNAFRRSENGPAERLLGKGSGVEQIEDEIVRRVLDGADLLQDDALFAFKLVAIEGAVGQNVGQNIEREPRVGCQNMGVVGGLLDTRRGIEIAPCGLDLFRDRTGGAAARALERHVFEQVRQALLVMGFVAGARRDPDPERGRLDVGHPVGDDAQAGRQRGDLDGHEAVFRA